MTDASNEVYKALANGTVTEGDVVFLSTDPGKEGWFKKYTDYVTDGGVPLVGVALTTAADGELFDLKLGTPVVPTRGVAHRRRRKAPDYFAASERLARASCVPGVGDAAELRLDLAALPKPTHLGVSQEYARWLRANCPLSVRALGGWRPTTDEERRQLDVEDRLLIARALRLA